MKIAESYNMIILQSLSPNSRTKTMFLDHLNGHTTQLVNTSGRLILKTPPYNIAKMTSYVATVLTFCVSILSYVGGVPTWKNMLLFSFICGTIIKIMKLI